MSEREYVIARNPDVQDGVDLARIAEELRGYWNAKIVRVVGPEALPERLVVKIAPQRAESLKARFGNRLIVEVETSRPTSPQPQVPPTTPTSRSIRGETTMVTRRKSQFLITAKPLAGMPPMALNEVQQALQNMSDVTVVKTLAPRGFAAALAEGIAAPPRVIVARMTDERASNLRQSAPPHVIIEPDYPLRYLVDGPAGMVAVGTDWVGTRPFSPVEEAFERAFRVTISVVGPENAPVPDAFVYVQGTAFPSQGKTDGNGQVTLQVVGGTIDTVRALYVKPAADYWDFYVRQPELSSDEGANVVTLTPLRRTFPDFPDQQMLGWGQKAMNLDKVPAQFTGRDVKIALIDSGVAVSHPDLDHVSNGFDIVNNDAKGWQDDTVFHGSHCAGIIAGNAGNNFGIRGFAPEAQVFAYKVFPGGFGSDLISALHDCIEKQVDIVNLSLGTEQPSQALEQEIQGAKSLGIACIVAAGNGGGTVEYPASSPNVLTVSAIGKVNEFPEDTYHAQTIADRRQVTGEGLFAPNFSNFGPQVAVCAPGVAVISSVPPRNFAAWDGTSIAAAHVTGLAALVLAHHPSFQGPFRQRNAQRVEQLFQIIRTSARPVNLGDPTRTGFGLPDAQRALPVFAAAGLPATSVDELIQYVTNLLSTGTSRASGAGTSGGQPSVEQARDYLIDEMKKQLREAGLS